MHFNFLISRRKNKQQQTENRKKSTEKENAKIAGKTFSSNTYQALHLRRPPLLMLYSVCNNFYAKTFLLRKFFVH